MSISDDAPLDLEKEETLWRKQGWQHDGTAWYRTGGHRAGESKPDRPPLSPAFHVAYSGYNAPSAYQVKQVHRRADLDTIWHVVVTHTYNKGGRDEDTHLRHALVVAPNEKLAKLAGEREVTSRYSGGPFEHSSVATSYAGRASEFKGVNGTLPSTYDHLMADFKLRPRQIAQHLRDAHRVEPKAAMKGYEREVWHNQHDQLHVGGISGRRYNLPSDHTSDSE